DLLGEQVERGRLADAQPRAVYLAEAKFRHPVQVLYGLVDGLAVLAQVVPSLRRLLDLVVIAALVDAVQTEHVQLARGLVERVSGDVAGVGVPGDQPERLLLAAAADQDRRGRPGQGPRRVGGGGAGG